MPGIYGFHQRSVSNRREVLGSMQQSMLCFPHLKQANFFVDNCIAASRTSLKGADTVTSSSRDRDSLELWIEGEVFNLAKVIEDYKWTDKPVANTEFNIWLLYAYQLGELDSFLNKIDGDFCAALYDPIRRKLLLISDRYGMRLLYWYQHNGVFAWASEVKGILALPKVDKSFDTTSFPCFIDLGYLLGEHTWFKHVQLIKPATVVEYDIAAEAVSQHYYWTWSEIKPINLGFDDAVDTLYEALSNAVLRRFNPDERIGITLSGGLDSRVILAIVDRLFPDYQGKAFTFGYPGSEDIKIAKQVISQSSWRHQVFHFTNTNWFDPRVPIVWATDGMLNIKAMHGVEFLDVMSSEIDINLNGYLGDVVAGGGWINPASMEQKPSINNLSDFYGDYGELAMLSESYFMFGKREPALYLSRARRFTNLGIAAAAAWVEQRKPFFDHAVIDWAFGIPELYRQNNHVYSEMLNRYFPKYFHDIPWQKTGKRVGVKKNIKPSILQRASCRIIKMCLGQGGSKEYADYSKWIRHPVIRKKLEALCKRTSSSQMLLAEDWQRKYLKPHLKRRANFSNEILRAATLEIYLRQVNGEPMP